MAHHMRIPNALLRIVRASMQALTSAHMDALNILEGMMTELEKVQDEIN